METIPLPTTRDRTMPHSIEAVGLDLSEVPALGLFDQLRERFPRVAFGTLAGLTILWSYLRDLSRRHASVDRWFRCGEPLLESDLGLVPPTQRRLLNLLESKGFLEIREPDRAASGRYLRLNPEALERSK